MKRLTFALFMVLAISAQFDMTVREASATPSAVAAAGDDIEDLKKTLSDVLRARRPEEFAFLDRVIDLVEAGRLPRSLVVSTFNWARKQPRHPFQYFEHGLRVRAKKIGVNI